MLASGQVPAQTAEQVNGQLDTLMNRDSMDFIRDMMVTKADAREAVALLESLPPTEYKRALETMDARTLGQMMTEMDDPTRKTFLEQARRKGAVCEEPGVKMPPREGSPPDKPSLIRNDASHRPELRIAIHAENVGRAAQYMRDFDAYVSRYSDAALNASSPMALRMMGPPVSEFVLYEPGLIGEKDNKALGTLQQGAATNRAHAAQAANDRISDFAGRARAGSFSAGLTGKIAARLFGMEVEAERTQKVSSYGKVDAHNKAEAKADLLTNYAVGIDAEGKIFDQFKAGAFSLTREGGKLTEAEGTVGAIGIKLEEDKTTLKAGLGATPFKTLATIDEKRGSYGGGVEVGSKFEAGEVGELEVSLAVSFEVQGVAPERLEIIGSMKDEGIWGPMPELDAKLEWNAIPKPRRDWLASDGWSSGNWPFG